MEEEKERMNLQDVYKSDFKKTGNPDQIRIRCIFCDESNYKLYIHLVKKVYICHKCGAKGRIQDNGELLVRLDIFDKKVKEFQDGKVRSTPVVDLPQEYIGPVKRSHGVPYSYLTKRGISQSEINRYRIGYCSTGKFRERVILPIYEGEKLTYFIGRAYTQRSPRYLNSNSGRSKVIFKTFTEPVKEAILVEGIFTAIYVSQVLPAIATLGKVVTEAQCKKIAQVVDKVYVMLDRNAKKETIQATFMLAHYIEALPIFIKAEAPDLHSHEELRRMVNAHLPNAKRSIR